jgi:hypothetical protein
VATVLTEVKVFGSQGIEGAIPVRVQLTSSPTEPRWCREHARTEAMKLAISLQAPQSPLSLYEAEQLEATADRMLRYITGRGPEHDADMG